MRIAIGFGTSALVLIGASSLGLVGPWALGAGAVLLLLAAVAATTAMEARDLTSRVGTQEPARSTVFRRAA